MIEDVIEYRKGVFAFIILQRTPCNQDAVAHDRVLIPQVVQFALHIGEGIVRIKNFIRRHVVTRVPLYSPRRLTRLGVSSLNLRKRDQ